MPRNTIQGPSGHVLEILPDGRLSIQENMAGLDVFQVPIAEEAFTQLVLPADDRRTILFTTQDKKVQLRDFHLEAATEAVVMVYEDAYAPFDWLLGIKVTDGAEAGGDITLVIDDEDRVVAVAEGDSEEQVATKIATALELVDGLTATAGGTEILVMRSTESLAPFTFEFADTDDTGVVVIQYSHESQITAHGFLAKPVSLDRTRASASTASVFVATEDLGTSDFGGGTDNLLTGVLVDYSPFPTKLDFILKPNSTYAFSLINQSTTEPTNVYGQLIWQEL